jgi:hypothetical protein
VELVKAFAPGLKGTPTTAWRPGERVVDVAHKLAPGTAIATFENGRYLHRLSGQHAAFFVSSAGAGMWVIRQAPEGWHASSPTVVRLDGGGMLSGDPKKMQYLVPSSSRKVKGGGTSTWNFDPSEQKWVYCTYGRMAVQLAKRMDDQATTCQVTVKYERKDVVAEITAVCR